MHDIYERELLKQTSPYRYYIENIERKDNGGTLLGSSPLFYDIREKIPDDYAKAERMRIASLKDDEKDLFLFLGDLFSDLKITLCNAKGTLYLIFMNSDCEADSEIIWSELSKGIKGVCYFDQDYVNDNGRLAPFFKPDFSYDTFMHLNYIRDIFAIDLETAFKVYRDLSVREDTKEAELFFLYGCLMSHTPVHIGKTAIHIRSDERTEEEIYDRYYRENSSEDILNAYEDLRRKKGYSQEKERYYLSIIIPSKDNGRVLKHCLDSILNASDLKKLKLQIIVVDNGSREEEKQFIVDLIEGINKKTGESVWAEYIYEPMEFNFSKMCDIGARASKGNLLMFMNDDIETGDPESLYRMCVYASNEEAGITGIKLLYPGSDLIQHAGVTDLDCGPSHKLQHHSDSKVYYFGINRFVINVMAVTAACFVLTREKYFNLNGFNDKMKVGYNDVDLCLKAFEKGYRNVVLNDTFMYHHESLSRGTDSLDDGKYTRLQMERSLLYREHPVLKERRDPFYSSRLIRDTLDYSVNVMPEYEKRKTRSHVRIPEENELKWLKTVHVDKNVHFNIESGKKGRAIDTDQSDYIEIEGWGLRNKADNSLYIRELFLIPESITEGNKDKVIDPVCVSLFPKKREDVIKVYKDSKKAELSGFVAKIPVDIIEKNVEYLTVFIMTSVITGKRYKALGEIYECKE